MSMLPPDAGDPANLERDAREEASALQARYGRLEPELVIELCVDRLFAEEITTVSSFGAESAVLLHMIAEIDRTLPVQFLDTGKHFSGTHAHRERLVEMLGLVDVRVVEPDGALLGVADPVGILFAQNADACCHVRKVEPMARAISPFRAWMTGRKRYQSNMRVALPVFEAVGSRVRINPLARWRAADVEIYKAIHRLPDHPLSAANYRSIGCQPCTRPVADGEADRAGRWAGLEKIECGIHLGGMDRALDRAPMRGTGQ
jgi:phosphoadenosine phosphosulfate reductase